jgi:hypothetical protein
VVEKNPADLEPELLINPNELILNPLLLNTGDFVIIKTLLTTAAGNIRITGRIAGIKDIQPVKEPTFWYYVTISGMILMLVGVVSVLISGDIRFIWLFFIGYLGFVVGASLRKKVKKKNPEMKN